MRLVSSAICKKPSLDIAEDFVGGHANFHWLLDGATPPNGDDICTLEIKSSKYQPSSPLTKSSPSSSEKILSTVLEFLGPQTTIFATYRLAKLLNFIQDKNFYCIVRSAYSYAEKKIYNLQFSICLQIIISRWDIR